MTSVSLRLLSLPILLTSALAGATVSKFAAVTVKQASSTPPVSASNLSISPLVSSAYMQEKASIFDSGVVSGGRTMSAQSVKCSYCAFGWCLTCTITM